MKTLTIIFFFIPLITLAQVPVSGTLTGPKGQPVIGANVVISGTYDGASTDTTGYFQFTTYETDSATLEIHSVGYHSVYLGIDLSATPAPVVLSLKEQIGQLNAITVEGSRFGIAPSQPAVKLKPLEVVTTAGALGDIMGAMQTMAGTQTVGESGRLFVRGGESYENQIYIDGLLVHTPYQSSINGLPARGRFDPFLFRGTSFGTGGFGAEYGQALSSSLWLDTKNLEVQTQTDISVMSVGTDVTHRHAGEKQSLAVKGEYINLAPYMALVPQNRKWYTAPWQTGGTLNYRLQPSENTTLKVYSTYNRSGLSLSERSLANPATVHRLSLDNENVYVNSSFRIMASKNTGMKGGISYTHDTEWLQRDADRLTKSNQGLHGKLVTDTQLNKKLSLKLGTEVFWVNYAEKGNSPHGRYHQQTSQFTTVGWTEAEWLLNDQFMLAAGGRLAYRKESQSTSFTPRLAAHYFAGKYHKWTASWGIYQQSLPVPFQLGRQLSDTLPALLPEASVQYGVGYEYVREGRLIRLQGYHKTYRNLLTYSSVENRSSYQNNGTGYARGVDLYYRDKVTIPNAEYWVSYSLLDTKRTYRDFPVAARPGFASTHNLSVVYKHFVSSIRSQLGFSYNYASERPFHNPNREGFMQSRTPAFHSLNLNIAYLIRQHIILYASATNVLGTKNIFGYEFTDQPDAQGVFASRPVTQPAPRFLFVGLFISLSRDQQSNQLDRL